MCRTNEGRVASVSARQFTQLQTLLDVWNHKFYMGDVWLRSNSTSNACNTIQVCGCDFPGCVPRTKLKRSRANPIIIWASFFTCKWV